MYSMSSNVGEMWRYQNLTNKKKVSSREKCSDKIRACVNLCYRFRTSKIFPASPKFVNSNAMLC